MAASVADHLKMSNHNTAKCFSAVEALAKNYATIASPLDEWDRWYATPTEPVVVVPPPPSAVPPVPASEPVAPTEPVSTAPVGTPSGFSGGGCSVPLSDHPSPRCIYHPAACPYSGWPGGGGRKHTNTPLTRSLQLLRGGEPPKIKKTPLSLNGGQCRSVRSILRSPRPLGPEWKRTPPRERTSIPSRKISSPPP